jgi:glycerophosphoryl diester phosphodiesterase
VTPQRATLIAHRGASLVAPENTLHAFALAVAGGADGLECDVRLSSDGEPIVFHDVDLERLTGLPGQLAAKPWAELRHLTIRGPGAGQGAPQTIPHLQDLVDFTAPVAPADHRPADRPSPSGRLIINVELKPLKNHAPLVAACRPYFEALARSPNPADDLDPLDPVDPIPHIELIISSFDPRVLAAFALAPLAAPHRLALLFEDPNALAALRFLPPATYDLHPEASLLTAATHAAWSSPGRRFRAWTVDDPIEARRLLTLDPTIALITNRPGPLAAELEEAS